MSLQRKAAIDNPKESSRQLQQLLRDLILTDVEWHQVTQALDEPGIDAIIKCFQKYHANPEHFEKSLMMELGKLNGQGSPRRTQLLRVIQSLVDRSKANRKQLGEQTRNRGAEQFHGAFTKVKQPEEDESSYFVTDVSPEMTMKMERPTFILSEQDLENFDSAGLKGVSDVEDFLEARGDTVEIQSLLNRYPEITDIWKAIKAKATKQEREIMKQVLPHAVHYYEIRRPRDIKYIHQNVTPILYNYSELTRLPLDTLYEMIGQLWKTLCRPKRNSKVFQ